MGAIGVIAVNAFRESLRDKILYNLVLFAGLLIGLSVLLADLSITEHHKVIADMGLAAINLIGVIIAMFVGISLVNKEIERRTIYTIMARPISRTLFHYGEIFRPGADVVW
jgi:Cu-processing system permease protein